MNIIQIENFIKLAQIGHVGLAAEKLYITQPSLSRSIKLLENKIGVKLFDRVTNRLVLNENGKIFLKHAQIIVNEYHDAMNEMNNNNKIVNLSISSGSEFLPNIIFDFQTKYPDIKVSISQKEIDNYNNNSVKIYSSSKIPNTDNTIVLLEEEILLAIPKNNELSINEKVSLNELENESFVSLNKLSDLRKITDEFFEKVDFHPNIILESDSPTTIRELLPLQIGLAFFPSITWGSIYKYHNIKFAKINDVKLIRYLIMSWDKTDKKVPEVELMKNFLINYFNSIKYQ